MALLRYQNLDMHRPDILMRMSVNGLKNFHDYLMLTKRHMESPAATKRLAWRQGSPPPEVKDDEGTDGPWVRLVEPDDRPSEPETTFRTFLDENTREVHVWQPEEGRPDSGWQQRGNLHFSSMPQIQVLDRHVETQQLCLGRLPAENTQLVLRPNTYAINCQLRALSALRDAPRREHLPLLRLFERLA